MANCWGVQTPVKKIDFRDIMNQDEILLTQEVEQEEPVEDLSHLTDYEIALKLHNDDLNGGVTEEEKLESDEVLESDEDQLDSGLYC